MNTIQRCVHVVYLAATDGIGEEGDIQLHGALAVIVAVHRVSGANWSVGIQMRDVNTY